MPNFGTLAKYSGKTCSGIIHTILTKKNSLNYLLILRERYLKKSINSLPERGDEFIIDVLFEVVIGKNGLKQIEDMQLVLGWIKSFFLCTRHATSSFESSSKPKLACYRILCHLVDVGGADIKEMTDEYESFFLYPINNFREIKAENYRYRLRWMEILLVKGGSSLNIDIDNVLMWAWEGIFSHFNSAWKRINEVSRREIKIFCDWVKLSMKDGAKELFNFVKFNSLMKMIFGMKELSSDRMFMFADLYVELMRKFQESLEGKIEKDIVQLWFDKISIVDLDIEKVSFLNEVMNQKLGGSFRNEQREKLFQVILRFNKEEKESELNVGQIVKILELSSETNEIFRCLILLRLNIKKMKEDILEIFKSINFFRLLDLLRLHQKEREVVEQVAGLIRDIPHQYYGSLFSEELVERFYEKIDCFVEENYDLKYALLLDFVSVGKIVFKVGEKHKIIESIFHYFATTNPSVGESDAKRFVVEYYRNLSLEVIQEKKIPVEDHFRFFMNGAKLLEEDSLECIEVILSNAGVITLFKNETTLIEIQGMINEFLICEKSDRTFEILKKLIFNMEEKLLLRNIFHDDLLKQIIREVLYPRKLKMLELISEIVRISPTTISLFFEEFQFADEMFFYIIRAIPTDLYVFLPLEQKKFVDMVSVQKKICDRFLNILKENEKAYEKFKEFKKKFEFTIDSFFQGEIEEKSMTSGKKSESSYVRRRRRRKRKDNSESGKSNQNVQIDFSP